MALDSDRSLVDQLAARMRAERWSAADVAARLRMPVRLAVRWIDDRERIWLLHDHCARLAQILRCSTADVEARQRAEFSRASLGPCCPLCGGLLLDRIPTALLGVGPAWFACQACEWLGRGSELVSRPGERLTWSRSAG